MPCIALIVSYNQERSSILACDKDSGKEGWLNITVIIIMMFLYTDVCLLLMFVVFHEPQPPESVK